MAAQLICNQWVAGSTPVTSSKKNPAIYRENGGAYRGIFALSQCGYCPECGRNVGQSSKNGLLWDWLHTDSICPCLYHTAVLWATICPCFGGIANHYTHITPLMGERYLIPTLYTRVSVRLTTPTQKSVSIDTSGKGVNLPDCTDLCNQLKIERVSMPSKLSVFQLRPFARSA